jgi:hypothetical protein
MQQAQQAVQLRDGTPPYLRRRRKLVARRARTTRTALPLRLEALEAL